MEFYISLNLKANQDLQLGLDVEHLLLLTYLLDKQKVKQYQNQSICENGNIYFWLNPKTVGLNLPILTNFCKTERAKIDKIRAMYKTLIEMGFMEAYSKNQEIAKAYYAFTEKSSLLLTENNVSPYENSRNSLTEKAVRPYEKNGKPLTEKTVSINITNDDNTNSNNTNSSVGTPPTNENDFVDFEVWEKAEPETLNEKKEKKEKSSAKKEKKEKPQFKTMIEIYPDEESFVNAWLLRFGAKYPKVDASKGYQRILHYCETSGKLYADYVRVLAVWYAGENETKRKSYEFDAQPKKSNIEILQDLYAGASEKLW